MQFDVKLEPDRAHVYAMLGFRSARPGREDEARLGRAADRLAGAARPVWVYRQLGIYTAEKNSPGVWAGTPEDRASVFLPGWNIERHLAGCTACLLLAVSLGGQVEQAIQAAEAQDMADAVVLDAAASALVEQYADAAEADLREVYAQKGLYCTTRYSPGYGDLPIDMQKPFLEWLNAQRLIGLTVSAGGLLTPRKSITAVMGLADVPVRGAQAGCEACALNNNCSMQSEGRYCDKKTV